MFTGIVEQTAIIENIESEDANLNITVKSHLTSELKIDQSLAHNGICLTVVSIKEDTYSVTAIKETIDKTNISQWKIGDEVNLERCLPVGGRLDGHMVQGHVDTTALCKNIEPQNGSYVLTFEYPEQFANLIIEKGSICVNGISLTCFDISEHLFKVAIIPYTWTMTNLKNLSIGQMVNIEFDILGKYILRHQTLALKKKG